MGEAEGGPRDTSWDLIGESRGVGGVVETGVTVEKGLLTDYGVRDRERGTCLIRRVDVGVPGCRMRVGHKWFSTDRVVCVPRVD